MTSYDRRILALTDSELEQFVRDWVSAKRTLYHEVARFSGAGDMGRDVVGFLTPARHQGEWHNFQCKQYADRLPTATALLELGKVLFYSKSGSFTTPTRFTFVAPRGLNRNLEKLIFNPESLKSALLDQWDAVCANGITEGKSIPLDGELESYIRAFNFSSVYRTALDDVLNDPSITPVLHKWFGADPGPAPRGSVPATVQPAELPYVAQLVGAYSQREGRPFGSHEEVRAHPVHQLHFVLQRERFYDADAFKRFYRDNTAIDVLETFERDIFHGIVDTCQRTFSDALARVDAVMSQAAAVQASGPLAQHARVPVKQGVCHHFVNEDRIRWK